MTSADPGAASPEPGRPPSPAEPAGGAFLVIGNPARPHHGGEALAVGGGAALSLADSAWFRWALHVRPVALRLACAGFALATARFGPASRSRPSSRCCSPGWVAMLAAERHSLARARAAPGR